MSMLLGIKPMWQSAVFKTGKALWLEAIACVTLFMSAMVDKYTKSLDII